MFDISFLRMIGFLSMESRDYLRQVVDFLSREIGVRTCQEPDRLDRAARYITDQFTSFGYHATMQSFPFNGKNYHNVIAELNGKGPSGGVLVMIEKNVVPLLPGMGTIDNFLRPLYLVASGEIITLTGGTECVSQA